MDNRTRPDRIIPDPNPGNDKVEAFEVNHQMNPSDKQMAIKRKSTYAEVTKKGLKQDKRNMRCFNNISFNKVNPK